MGVSLDNYITSYKYLTCEAVIITGGSSKQNSSALLQC